jgi:hypothetical protein
MCPDGLGINPTVPPQVSIRTEAQAVNYVLGLVAEMEKLRVACDVPYTSKGPGDPTVAAIQRMAWAMIEKQGQVVGAINAFRLSGLLSERAWAEFHQRAINALASKVVVTH